MAAALRLEGASRSYGPAAAALVDATLEIAQGEWVSVVGPSGSGKSTLLNLAGGLDLPTAGRVETMGADWARMVDAERARHRRENVGFVFQQFHLIPYLTVLENVMVAQYLHSLPDRLEALSALESVGIAALASRRPATLSGGERQRACVARAVVNRPALLLADEPTGNLDAESEETVLALLSSLHRDGHTLVVVTHDTTVARLAERRIELRHGRIVRSETAAHPPQGGPT